MDKCLDETHTLKDGRCRDLAAEAKAAAAARAAAEAKEAAEREAQRQAMLAIERKKCKNARRVWDSDSCTQNCLDSSEVFDSETEICRVVKAKKPEKKTRKK